MKRSSTLLSVAAVVAALCLPGTASAVSIYSKDLLPADGTTGQTLTTGKGVKTGHIQNGAVTNQKLADGAVSGTKIADGVVTDTKLGFGAVTTTKIADGAVTDEKVSGTISGSKLGAHSHAAGDLTGVIGVSQLPVGIGPDAVAAGNHNHDAAYLKKFSNVVIVATSGGDYTSPVDAVASVSGASAANPWVVLVMPGTYDLGGQSLVLKPYVHLRGMGAASKIIGNVVANSGNEVSFLSIENYSAGTSYGNVEGLTIGGSSVAHDLSVKVGGAQGHNLAVVVWQGNPTIFHVTAEVAGNAAMGGQKSWGFYVSGPASATITDSRSKVVDCSENHGIGLANGAVNVVLENVVSEATGAHGGQAMWTPVSTYTMRNSTLIGGSVGLVNGPSSTGFIEGSVIKGPQGSIAIYYNSNLMVANSRLEGAALNWDNASGSASTMKFLNVYDQNLSPITTP